MATEEEADRGAEEVPPTDRVLENGPREFTWTEVTNLLQRYNACRKLPV